MAAVPVFSREIKSALLIAMLVVAAGIARGAAADYTTYVVTLPGADHATMERVEALGGSIDHHHGGVARAYIHHSNWGRFLASGIPYAIESMQPPPSKQLEDYPTYAQIGAILTAAADTNPDIVRLVTLGQSVLGRELWALRISDQPDLDEDEPEVAYISTMHGDETAGTVLCLNFLDELLDGYGRDAQITSWIDETEIWLLPLMNPDGYELGMRSNANGKDLNRSFPDYPGDFSGTLYEEPMDTSGREPEVAHVMNWSAANSFVLIANYHSGELVVNYPYDKEPEIPSGQPAPTPDDALMRDLSLAYARLNPPLFANPEFPGGITNGSAWFSISGGMQDWHYRYAGQVDLTLEISIIKSPDAGTLLRLWNDNRDSMFAFLAQVHRGARGVVTDRLSGEPLHARVQVDSNPQPVFTDADAGDFHRLLLPGSYRLTVTAPGYIPYTTAAVPVSAGAAARVDAGLSKGDVNGDGAIDAVDLQLVINAVLGLPSVDGADVDGGGATATDVQHLVNRVLGRALPAPG